MSESGLETIVIGAGIAGLTAARTLAEAGLPVTILEARSRIGGRILTHHVADQSIELGAEFIHGRPPELWALIDEAGLKTYERGGSQACFQNGVLKSCHEEERSFHLLEGLEDFHGPDMSFAEYAATLKASEAQRTSILTFVEGFNAADANQISAAALGVQQKAEDSIQGDQAFYLRGGYDRIAQYLASRIVDGKGSILLNTPAQEIRWHPGSVTVTTKNQSFSAARIIVTIPLGVLQAGTLAIHPRPDAILQAASQLRMGYAVRFTLHFREPFWTRPRRVWQKDLSFLFSFEEIPPVWWTTHPHPSALLTGWIGGPRCAELASLTSDEIAERACSTLARIFSLEPDRLRKLLIGCHYHDWLHDPYALGAYSYVASGALDAPRQLSEPVADTLFFAGEHTDTTGHWGTVHAAMRSGQRAALQVLGTT
ncbi:MAG TPA: NAD(P)/FAD-dependent oxidoreductase [Edaphobacter sp.]|jgi:monoamine oxidase|nr:NAD(P)/FAD-dependent oxidoreductase [Edaphobacter sp.]